MLLLLRPRPGDIRSCFSRLGHSHTWGHVPLTEGAGCMWLMIRQESSPVWPLRPAGAQLPLISANDPGTCSATPAPPPPADPGGGFRPEVHISRPLCHTTSVP